METFKQKNKLENSQDGRDQTLKTSKENKEENSNINDAEFEEMSTEMKDEIEKMKPAEKKTFLDGIANMGYKISEIKNNTFRGIYSSLSQMSTKSDFLHRYFNSYAGIYDKESKKAKQKKEQIGKGIIATGSGLGQGAGTLFKYGRVLYDAKDHIGCGLQRLNPFRHITAAAMFAGRSAEAGKEMRFEYDSVKEKTRVKDEEKAIEEALDIYEKVYGKEGLEKFKKGEKASESIYNEKGEIDRKKEEEQKAKFEKAYKNNLPEDIKNRLNKMDFPLTKWYKIYFDKSKDTKVYIDRLIKKIDKIENNKKLNNKEKENKKQALLKSKEALLTDLDKMIGDDGTVDSISYYSRMAEKVSKGVATALIIDSVGRIAKTGWELRHLLDRFDNDDVTLEQDFELSKTDKEVMKNLEDLSVEDKKYIAENGLSRYMENKEQKQFNDTLDSINNDTENSINNDIKVNQAVTDNNTANKLPVDKSVNNKVNTSGVGIKEIEKVYDPVKVEIKGKINTLSEAVSKALHSERTTADVKDNFIHKWSGDDINIDENNRDELLNQAIRKMLVANMDNDTKNDVLNLIHEGDVVSIDKDGNIKVNTESGIKAKAVSELQLRENWADIEGAKHGFEADEVSFGGDENNLGERSYDVDVNGAKVNIDSDGNFKATVEGEKVSGDISDLKGGETAKDFISEKINNAKVEIEANKIREKGIAEFEKIIGKSELTQNNAEKFGINFNDGLSKSEIAKIKFVIDQKLVDSPEQAKHIFKLSNKTGIAYDKPHFINAYKLMPDDIKASKNIEKAEGFLQTFAGTKKQVGEGLRKLGISGKTWTKNVHETIIVEDAFGKEGVKVFLTEQKISCEKSRFISLFGTRKIFNEKLSLDNINKLKNIFGIKMEKAINGISSNEKSIFDMQ